MLYRENAQQGHRLPNVQDQSLTEYAIDLSDTTDVQADLDTVTTPPMRLNPDFFTLHASATSKLERLASEAKGHFNEFSSESEDMEGMYVVGSQARGTFTPSSDLDLYIHATVSYLRGKMLTNEIAKEMNGLQEFYDIFEEQTGIDLDNVEESELRDRGFVDDDEPASSIQILNKQGLLSKGDIVDVSVWAARPYGISYNVNDDEWVKYSEETDNSNAFRMSQLLQHGYV